MSTIAMRSVDCDFVATLLQANSSINDQTLCSTDTQIRVEEDNSSRLCRWFGIVHLVLEKVMEG